MYIITNVLTKDLQVYSNMKTMADDYNLGYDTIKKKLKLADDIVFKGYRISERELIKSPYKK